MWQLLSPLNFTQLMISVSIGDMDPLYNRKAIVDDVLGGCARSALATVLLDQWACGEIAGPQVQHMAQAAITNGSQHL